jgi:hypothetical protein
VHNCGIGAGINGHSTLVWLGRDSMTARLEKPKKKKKPQKTKKPKNQKKTQSTG